MARLMVPNGGSESCCRRRISSGRARTRRAMSSRNFSSTQRVILRPRWLVVHFSLSGGETLRRRVVTNVAPLLEALVAIGQLFTSRTAIAIPGFVISEILFDEQPPLLVH